MCVDVLIVLERVLYVSPQVLEVLVESENPPFTLMINVSLHFLYSLSSGVRLFF